MDILRTLCQFEPIFQSQDGMYENIHTNRNCALNFPVCLRVLPQWHYQHIDNPIFKDIL